MSLFKLGQFRLHSGAESDFKIDCDALDDDDVEVAALLIARRVRPFRRVWGIPSGGIRLARALKHYVCKAPGSTTALIVDDVYTTGHSLRLMRSTCTEMDVMGAVIFARATPEPWVTALFTLSPEPRDTAKTRFDPKCPRCHGKGYFYAGGDDPGYHGCGGPYAIACQCSSAERP